VVDATLEPATDDEIASTTSVMGGVDWQRWIDAFDGAGLIQAGFRTVAFDYVGPEVTHEVYRSGTIGAAKADLESTARRLHDRLRADGGGAWVSVNAAAVTQSSVAIPAVPLYLSLLMAVTLPDGTYEGPAEQIRRLFDDYVTGPGGPELDGEGRIRLDDWELDAGVQADIAQRWSAVTTETLDKYGDFGEFRRRFRRLYGFDVDGIDYDQPVQVDVPLTG
jgi:enoyl-[acyl-carrier protein] reductase/trans-2-enoyl-CoA reductase (NAD+)